MSAARTAFVALGSNLGDRTAHLAAAIAALGAADGIDVIRTTAAEETTPLGDLVQPAYLNAMVRLRTTLPARDLLACCHAIERLEGRERGTKWASRTLDLDVVWMEDALCDRPDLALPHPGVRDRAFWARQLAELEADD